MPAPGRFLGIAVFRIEMFAINVRLAFLVVRECDSGGLSSAVGRPMHLAFGEAAYPTIFLKAAALMQSLAENQSFVGGNKRIARFAGKAFLHLNGYRLRAAAEDGDELFRARIAKGMTVPNLQPGSNLTREQRRPAKPLCTHSGNAQSLPTLGGCLPASD